MPTLVDKVAAIKAALSIPDELELLPAIGAAMQMIGVAPEPGASLMREPEAPAGEEGQPGGEAE